MVALNIAPQANIIICQDSMSRSNHWHYPLMIGYKYTTFTTAACQQSENYGIYEHL